MLETSNLGAEELQQEVLTATDAQGLGGSLIHMRGGRGGGGAGGRKGDEKAALAPECTMHASEQHIQMQHKRRAYPA